MTNTMKNNYNFLRIAIEKGNVEDALKYMNIIRRNHENITDGMVSAARNMIKMAGLKR